MFLCNIHRLCFTKLLWQRGQPPSQAIIFKVSTHHYLKNNCETSKLLYSTKPDKEKSSSGKVDLRRENHYQHLTFGQKVAEAGTDLSYMAVIVVGIGVTIYLLYTIGSELFSSTGATAVFNAGMKKILNDTRVLDALGEPIKAHGETSRRGRRQRVLSTEFVENGEEHTRVRFYIKGHFRSAVVHAEVYKSEEGKREFEYLVVELDGYPPKTITVAKRDRQVNNMPTSFM